MVYTIAHETIHLTHTDHLTQSQLIVLLFGLAGERAAAGGITRSHPVVADSPNGFAPLTAARHPERNERPRTEADFPEAIEAILAGIHDPRRMPFGNPWTDAPRDELILNSLRHWWSVRGNVTPEHWQLPFAVRHDDTFVGVQELAAKDFAVTRTVGSGSWLTRSAQGQGIGVEMRTAILLLAFDHLGAEFATTAAFVDNTASNGVSRKVGYLKDGREMLQRRPGEPAEHQRYLLTPDRLNRPEWELGVSGLEPCLRMLGTGPIDR